MTMQVCRKVNEHVCPRQGSYMVHRGPSSHPQDLTLTPSIHIIARMMCTMMYMVHMSMHMA